MSNIVKFEIDTYNQSFPMRVQNVGFSTIEGGTMVSLAIATRREITAIDATATILDPFGGEFWTGRIVAKCLPGGKSSIFTVTRPRTVDIPWDIAENASGCEVAVHKIICDGKELENDDAPDHKISLDRYNLINLWEQYGYDAVTMPRTQPWGWSCVCGGSVTATENIEQSVCPRCGRKYTEMVFENVPGAKVRAAFTRLSELSGAIEIKNEADELALMDSVDFSQELLDRLGEIARVERIYGNMKEPALKAIQDEYEWLDL